MMIDNAFTMFFSPFLYLCLKKYGHDWNSGKRFV
jgi:hypothetical protein